LKAVTELEEKNNSRKHFSNKLNHVSMDKKLGRGEENKEDNCQTILTLALLSDSII